VGDVVSCYVELIKQGNTSMSIAVEVWAQPASGGGKYRVTEGTFVFVSITNEGKPRAILQNK
ncbi:acyl-CoA thioesterase, partial [bacterium]|nr:acyl-CoA thioesterase [bacterium]